jgi:signal peptidase
MKPFKIIYYIFLTFIVAIALLLIISVFPITGNIKFFIVQSGSMEPAIKMGGIVMIKPVDEYKIGDVISFGEVTRTKSPTTHRIHDMKVIEGNPIYITKGDANNAPDQREIRKRDILGKVLLDISYLGFAVDFAKKPIGFALIIGIPAVVIISDEVRKIYEEIKKRKTDKSK